MKNYFTLLLVALSCISCSSSRMGTPEVNWNAFLEQHDLIWDTIPANYYAGAILGNGHVGTNIYADKQAHTYRWDIGRVDINEYRSGTNILFDRARLPLGYFSLTTQGEVLEEDMRLSLQDATARGSIRTTEGSLSFTTYVHANENVIRTELVTEGGEQGYTWNWNPAYARSPRVAFPMGKNISKEEYPENPAVEVVEDGAFLFSIQRLYSGKCYVVASHQWSKQNKTKIDITVSLADSDQEAVAEAKATLQKFAAQSPAKVYAKHTDWWKNFYPSSYVTFADAQMESFYWVQMYKLACLTRPDKFVIDLQGPWTNSTPWPATWWNLNTQLTYSPLFTANRLEFSEPLWNSLNDNLDNLIANVPVKEWQVDAAGIGRSSSLDLVSPIRPDLVHENKYEVGNLTWVLYYYYEYCRYKPDDQELVSRFYPLLKRSVAYYEHILYLGDDGLYHLPVTGSPEYKEAPDCNYDLALLRWGLQTLLEVNTAFDLGDAKAPKWLDIQEKLIDYPADEDGYLIGEGVKLTYSHRHYSHLMMIYPLQLVSWDREEERDRITKSIDHWLGMPGYHQGYTFTGAASMYALQQNGDQAYDCLKQLIDKFIQPNTLYRESGPVVETPFSAVTSLQELYLQSSAEHIRVFPAVPTEWEEACFLNWKAYGGYTVSAIRRAGSTQYVAIEAAKEGGVVLESDWTVADLDAYNSKGEPVVVEATNQGAIQFHLNPGEVVHLVRKGYEIPKDVTQLHHTDAHRYGYRK